MSLAQHLAKRPLRDCSWITGYTEKRPHVRMPSREPEVRLVPLRIGRTAQSFILRQPRIHGVEAIVSDGAFLNAARPKEE
jgi:hypothetical protein